MTPSQITEIVLSLAVIALSIRMRILAKALREQAQLTREAFESIGYLCAQLNAYPGESSPTRWEKLEQLRLRVLERQSRH